MKTNQQAQASRGSQLLQAWLLEHRVTDTKLGAALDVSAQTVMAWRTGKGLPRVVAAVALERFTGQVVTVHAWADPPVALETEDNAAE